MGDQPKAIEKLTQLMRSGNAHQTLLGVTGSGKTFTMANVIANLGRPTLIISHNKTLASQLYQEFKTFFPENAVHYFVSYYDYYQPEAYIPQSDTYIEKDAKINDLIDAMRHATTATALTRRDFVIIASVSCIYGIGDPIEYAKAALEIKQGISLSQRNFLKKLVEIQYERNDIDPRSGTFRVRGESVEIMAPAGNEIISIEWDGNTIDRIVQKPTGIFANPAEHRKTLESVRIFPAKHFVTPQEKLGLAISNIELELKERVAELKKQGKILEAERIRQRTGFDMKMLKETGYTHGVENYSRQLAFRKAGDPPATLLDYLPNDFVTFIDESHMTLPQIRGMYAGDRARKQTLIEYGFRLPSAADNRPLTFAEFNERIGQVVYVSATPAEYELEKSTAKPPPHQAELGPPPPYKGGENKKKQTNTISIPRPPLNKGGLRGGEAIVEQLIRPTGLLDPKLEIRKNVDDLMKNIIGEIEKRVAKKERVLVTTLTKRMAEDLSEFLKEEGVRTEYLHSDIKTIERTKILNDLRKGTYDVIVGINLLREGLDLPEVSLVIILDADKEGFLRNTQTLIQTIGRAARHTDGTVIMYADRVTDSMKIAINETNRRRVIQEAYNTEHGITPQPTTREISDTIFGAEVKKPSIIDLKQMDKKMSREMLKKELTAEMLEAAQNLDFERAAELRDAIAELDEKKHS